jgi:hypothetical protein
MTVLRIKILLCLALTVPLGFGLKFYPGPGACWCNPYGAAVLYEVFWCLAAYFFFTKPRNIPVIAVTVFLVTCGLELLQLWHPPLLEAVRGFSPGAWLIGTGFDWLDFPHYVFGSLLGAGIMLMIDRK